MRREYYKIEDGEVIGFVSTDKVGSHCEFTICSVEEAEEMDNDEFEQCAQEAMWGSGMMEWGY